MSNSFRIDDWTRKLMNNMKLLLHGDSSGPPKAIPIDFHEKLYRTNLSITDDVRSK